MYINGMFISAILDIFRFIEKNYVNLAHDIRTGKINSELKLDDNTRKLLEKTAS